MKAGNFKLELCQNEGFWLIAPDSYWKATPEEIDEHTGGCGPGWFGDLLVPDTMYGESVFLACQVHDWMYYEGLTLEDKKVADLCFLVNMVLLINDEETLDRLRLIRAMEYYMAVSFHGQDAFLAGKKGHKNGLAET